MNNTSKNIGYLRGLLEGAKFDENPVTGKLFGGIVTVLGELADRLDVVDELLDDLNDYVESIDDDLSALEGDLPSDAPGFNFLDGDEDDDIDFDDDFDSREDQLHLLRPDTPAQDDPEIESLGGALCPQCRRMFFVNLADPEGSLYDCPHCAAKNITPEPLTPENTPVVHPAQN